MKRTIPLGVIPLCAVLMLAACSGTSQAPSATGPSAGSGGASGSGGSGVSRWAGQPVSEAAVPLGDGKVSTSPEAGYEDSCVTQFPKQGRPGGSTTPPWINAAAATWDRASKPSVRGSVTWSGAQHSFTVSGTSRVLRTNDLPDPGSTGTFPISPSDPAYQYDRNPNHVASQSLSWTVPADPSPAASPSCTPLGPIGVFLNGVVLFNALDAQGRDAGAHEIQDRCAGHPNGQDMYHYHSFSPCLETSANSEAGSSTLIGYALDGYGIYLERDAAGNLPTDADLDACHGRTSTVMWDGKQVRMYHYDVTLEYPYFVGCFHGTPVTSGRGARG